MRIQIFIKKSFLCVQASSYFARCESDLNFTQLIQRANKRFDPVSSGKKGDRNILGFS